jgi:hypothetical protein
MRFMRSTRLLRLNSTQLKSTASSYSPSHYTKDSNSHSSEHVTTVGVSMYSTNIPQRLLQHCFSINEPSKVPWLYSTNGAGLVAVSLD